MWAYPPASYRIPRRPAPRLPDLLAHAGRALFLFSALGMFGIVGSEVLVRQLAAAEWQSLDTVHLQELTMGRLPLPLHSRFLDRNGSVLFETFHDARRRYTPGSQISPYLNRATVAAEDAGFFEHMGVSLPATARALRANLEERGIVQGASTLEQQIIKNVITPSDQRAQQNPERKWREVLLAIELNYRFSKDQILEWYLNLVCYGNFSCGAEEAAQTYFHKSASDLDLAESALLAGIPQAPSLHDPLRHPEAAKSRQGIVLDLMVKRGLITPDEAETARGKPLTYYAPRFLFEAPHFSTYVQELVEARYGRSALAYGGLTITTTLDLELNNRAQNILREATQSADFHNRNANNAALVAIDPTTGEVLAMVGSANFEEPNHGQINMALAPRQPGSQLKPFLYLEALKKGWGPKTQLLDAPTCFRDGAAPCWVPNSVDGRYRELVTFERALAASLNTPAVLALDYVGIPTYLNTLRSLGITTLEDRYYGRALALGAAEVRLYDVVWAFTALANNGVHRGQLRRHVVREGLGEVEPVLIRKIEGPDGRVLEEFSEPTERTVFPERHAREITRILSDNELRAEMFGRHNRMNLTGWPAGVKTGTTDANRDNWVVGYTPRLVTGVWVGNADNAPMASWSLGSTTAVPIWNTFMEQALAETPGRDSR